VLGPPNRHLLGEGKGYDLRGSQMVMARIAVGALALSLMGSGALAFQETKGGAASGQQPAAQQPPKALDLGSEGPAAKPSGTEVRIPGLGKLGVLPKLDFGLELLYGVNDDQRPESEKTPQDPADDGVQIRGSVKHRF
jgi:hypothetical protein